MQFYRTKFIIFKIFVYKYNKFSLNFCRNPIIEDEYLVPVEIKSEPRNVAQMKEFGNQLAKLQDTEDPIMDLNDLEEQPRPLRQSFLRQNDENENADDDDQIRCIPKVMQVSFKNAMRKWNPDFIER